jgi:nucleotide-binding universal stress UspA family protein
MVERITVAIDGGNASSAALAWVIDRAAITDLAVEITTVVGIGTDLPGGSEVDYRTPSEQFLAQAVATLHSAAPRAGVTHVVRLGLPFDALVQASHDADLLVIGTNKTSPVAGIVHGTLPLKVAGRAACTTVVVPANWAPVDGPVVVGWIDEEDAERALDFAALEAKRLGVGLTIVHAWSMPAVSPMDGAAQAIVVEQLVAANRRLLADSARRIRAEHPALTVTEEMHMGSAAVAIVRAASTASLVVLGSRGRGAIAGMFLGSVSHDVLLNMPAPVAVVPSERTVRHELGATAA